MQHCRMAWASGIKSHRTGYESIGEPLRPAMHRITLGFANDRWAALPIGCRLALCSLSEPCNYVGAVMQGLLVDDARGFTTHLWPDPSLSRGDRTPSLLAVA